MFPGHDYSRSAAVRHQFGQLHGIQGRALADVVGHHPQVQPARMREVLADAADEHRVAAGRVGDRRRIATRLAIIHHDHPRRGFEQGDEKYLPARDKGPVRRYVRDFVDARLSIGTLPGVSYGQGGNLVTFNSTLSDIILRQGSSLKAGANSCYI